jgi:hypothetical protein
VLFSPQRPAAPPGSATRAPARSYDDAPRLQLARSSSDNTIRTGVEIDIHPAYPAGTDLMHQETRWPG